MRHESRAFTLIEILIGIAIVSLLMGMMIPAVSGVRRAARQAECAATQQRLYRAAIQHAMDNRERLPGVNTTGRPYLGSINAALQLEGDTTPMTPTSTFDWISPTIGLAANLSPNRARRTKQIFEDLGCPEAHHQNDQTWGYSNDLYDDFVPLLEQEGIGQISYMAPGPFHYAGPAHSPTRFKRFGWSGPAVPPPKYLPRLEQVGDHPAMKVFVADGTRYLTAGGVLDFDVHPSPEFYGSFTSATPIYHGSTAYGTGPAAPGFDVAHGNDEVHALRRELSYRHAGSINAIHFDGHYGPMTETESKTDASAWYPSGSRFTGENATPESIEFHREGEILP